MRTKEKIKKTDNKQYKEEQVTFGKHGIKLAGKIVFPENASPQLPVPAVVLCHGFGAGQKAMMPSAVQLAKKGIASIVFDFRGHCQSEGVVDGKMFEDVIDAWHKIREYSEIDKSRMALAGHSMGAMASIIAAEKLENPKAIVALSCPPEIDGNEHITADNYGQWGMEHPHVIKEYPREGAYPWLKGISALQCRAWMYFFGYSVRVDLANLIKRSAQVRMTEILKKLENCNKLFVFCQGDNVTPFFKSAPVYQAACEPKSIILSKGGFHSKPIMPGNLCMQWTSWLANILTKQ